MVKPRSHNVSELTSSERLRKALAEMSEGGITLTASAVCERAGLSRNALYRYHPEIVAALRDLQGQRRKEGSSHKLEVQRLRNENAALLIQVEQLGSLVDHYFGAWQEVNGVLKRRERELSELRKAKIVPLR